MIPQKKICGKIFYRKYLIFSSNFFHFLSKRSRFDMSSILVKLLHNYEILNNETEKIEQKNRD